MIFPGLKLKLLSRFSKSWRIWFFNKNYIGWEKKLQEIRFQRTYGL